MSTDDIDPELLNGSDMASAARRLRLEVAVRQRRKLNETSEAVFTSHAGRPADEVLEALRRKTTSAQFEPTEETLRSAADAISTGQRYIFE